MCLGLPWKVRIVHKSLELYWRDEHHFSKRYSINCYNDGGDDNAYHVQNLPVDWDLVIPKAIAYDLHKFHTR